MQSIIDHLKLYRSAGYTEDFRFLDGRLQGIRQGRFYTAEQLDIIEVKEIRYEGEDAYFVLYAIQTDEGGRGTLVLSIQHPFFTEVCTFLNQIGPFKPKEPFAVSGV